MKLMWLGCASLLLKEGETCVAVDPFMGIPKKHAAAKRKTFGRAQDVLVTHGHFDHIAQIAELYAGTFAHVYCTRTPAKRLVRDGVPEEQLSLLGAGCESTWEGAKSAGSGSSVNSFRVGDLCISAYPVRHCRFDRDLVLRKIFSSRTWRNAPDMLRLLYLNWMYKENEEIRFYEIGAGEPREWESNTSSLIFTSRLQIMGSLGLREDVSYPTGADILVLPYQGRSDLEEQAMAILRCLKPKRVLLDHYDDAFPPMTEAIDTRGIEARAREELGIACEAMKVGRIYQI